MDTSKQLMVVGTLVVIVSAVTGIILTSQSTISATPPVPVTIATSHTSRLSESSVDEKDAEWKSRLTPVQYLVTRKKGAEPAFTGKYWNSKAQGTYRCVCCKTPLFDSSAKFDSGTGWPSFYQPIEDAKIDEVVDFSLVTERTEVICRNCKAHLGYRFDDAPQQPTGLRYRINSASLDFQENDARAKPGE